MTEPDPNIIYKTPSKVQHPCDTPHQTPAKGYFSASLVDYGPGTIWRCPDCGTIWKLRRFAFPESNLVSWHIRHLTPIEWLRAKLSRRPPSDSNGPR